MTSSKYARGLLVGGMAYDAITQSLLSFGTGDPATYSTHSEEFAAAGSLYLAIACAEALHTMHSVYTPHTTCALNVTCIPIVYCVTSAVNWRPKPCGVGISRQRTGGPEPALHPRRQRTRYVCATLKCSHAWFRPPIRIVAGLC